MSVNINDYEILDRANQFKNATNILKSLGEMIPLELNACLACELYMKYLISFKKDNISSKTVDQLVKGHNLKDLYDGCSEDIKNEIKRKMGDNFENSLDNVKSNFKIIRYDYEFENVIYSPDFFVKFMDVLSKICNIKMPV